MTTRPWTVVDAFTDRAFRGNPAAVLQLQAHDALDDDVLLQIAAEANLSETAFLVPGAPGRWALRWCTPTVEVDLCGHATLASAAVLFADHPDLDRIVFDTRSGELVATRADDDAVTIDLPATPVGPVTDDAVLAAVTSIVGQPPVQVLASDPAGADAWLVAVLPDADAVRACSPDLAAIAALPFDGLVLTAPGDSTDGADRRGLGEADIASRYFTPQHGIDEDPVTGSAHCVVGPWWAHRLGRSELVADQVSPRGGRLFVHVGDDGRVLLTGHTVTVVSGHLHLPG